MEKYTNNAGDGNELLKVLSARDSHSIYRYAMERSSQMKLGVHAEQESRAMDKSQRKFVVVIDGVGVTLGGDAYAEQAIRSLVNGLASQKKDLDEARDRAMRAEKEIEAWKDASGLECGGDPDGVTPAKAKEFWDSEAKRIEVAEHEREAIGKASRGESCRRVRGGAGAKKPR